VPVPRIHIVVASTRDGRRGGRVGAWFAAIACARGDLEAEVVDLLDWDLPWYHAAEVPARGTYRDEATRRWAAKVAEADGFVLVCPEYNHGYPASMKNALDLVYAEWSHKPVTFVTYGGSAGGVRASEQLVQVAVELKMAPLRAQVHIPMAGRVFARDGTGEPEPRHVAQAAVVLDELVWWARALRAARDEGVPAEPRRT
jgi:NAD(P)H-dependent FMN reductase